MILARPVVIITKNRLIVLSDQCVPLIFEIARASPSLSQTSCYCPASACAVCLHGGPPCSPRCESIAALALEPRLNASSLPALARGSPLISTRPAAAHSPGCSPCTSAPVRLQSQLCVLLHQAIFNIRRYTLSCVLGAYQVSYQLICHISNGCSSATIGLWRLK